jgi:WD40 repeat protein/serine/threonine protein kinase
MADPPDSMTIEEIVEEFLHRQRQGEAPGVEEYARRFPSLADEIRRTLPALALILQFRPEAEDSSDPAADARDRQPSLPERIGDYRILGLIGRGGMGVVYEAEQLSLGRRVALKVLPQRAALADRSLARFRREARAAARLHHTNIVPVFEVGEDGEVAFYAMQLIQGRGLDAVIDDLRRLRRDPPTRQDGESSPERFVRSLVTGRFRTENLGVSPPPPGQPGPSDADTSSTPSSDSAVLPGRSGSSDGGSGSRQYYRSIAHLGVQAAEALAYAHARGVLHRDVKPSNLILDSAGVVWLTDFGLAKTDDEELTRSGDVLGTVRYMAPERFAGEGDLRADVYSLGMTLYELLVLEPAFDSPDRLGLIERIRQEDPAPPRVVDRQVPRDLETVVLKAIDKAPRRRYQSAEELAMDLRRFLEGEPVRARRTTLPERFFKWVRRRPTAAAVYLLLPLVVLLATAGTLTTHLWLRAEEAGRLAEQERESARAAQRVAERERATARAAERSAERQRGLAEKASYVHRVMRAHFEWLDNDAEAASRLLRQCPEGLRDWEWHYLQRLCHSERFTLDAGQPLNCVAYSPDGQRIAAGGKEGGLFIWERDPERPQRQWKFRALASQTKQVLTVCFSPDGGRIVTGGSDGPAEVWDARTGRSLHTLEGHTHWVIRACFSPDGKRIATSSHDRTVKLWNARDGTEILTLNEKGPWGAVGLSFSPDGKRLLTLDSDGTLTFRDVQTGRALRSARLPGLNTKGICYSPDGKRLAAWSNADHVKVWDAETFREVLALELPTPAYIADLCFRPDGQQLVLATSDQRVQIWDAHTGKVLRALQGHHDHVMGVRFRPDGKELVSVSLDGTVKGWDPDREQRALPLGGHRDAVTSVCFRPDGKRLASASRDLVKLSDPTTGRQLLALEGASGARSLGFRPDGKRLAVGLDEGAIQIRDAQTGQILRTLPGHRNWVHSVCYSPDGQWLASASQDGTVRLWEARTGQPARTWRFDHVAFCVCFSPDGTRLAASAGKFDGPGIVKVWDARSGQEVLRLTGHPGEVRNVCFSPDGKRIATGSSDEKIRVWDSRTGRLVLPPLTGHRSKMISGLSFSPDGERLASGGWDKTIRVWDLRGGEEVLVLAGLPGRVNSLCFSPDGKHLASGGGIAKRPGTVHVWAAPGYVPRRGPSGPSPPPKGPQPSPK